MIRESDETIWFVRFQRRKNTEEDWNTRDRHFSRTVHDALAVVDDAMGDSDSPATSTFLSVGESYLFQIEGENLRIIIEEKALTEKA